MRASQTRQAKSREKHHSTQLSTHAKVREKHQDFNPNTTEGRRGKRRGAKEQGQIRVV